MNFSALCNTTDKSTQVEPLTTNKQQLMNPDQKTTVIGYSLQWKDNDVVIVVENEQFHIHSTMLKLNSPVFATMFKHNTFVEGQLKTTPLPGKRKKYFTVFLDLLYQLSARSTLNDGE